MNSEEQPSYFSLYGNNGFRAVLQNRTNSSQAAGLNYFIRFWTRPYNNFNVTNEKQAEVLFEIPGSIRCQIQFQNTLACFKPGSTNQDDFIFLQRIPMSPGMWVHFSICGQRSLNRGFLAADYSDQQLKNANTSYLRLNQTTTPWLLFIGVTSSLLTGLTGDIREFLITEEMVTLNQVKIIKNSYIAWSEQHLAYFRFQNGVLWDESRKHLNATMISQSSRMPVESYDNAPNDICFPIIDHRTDIPQIDNLNFSAITLDSRMRNISSNYSYSISIWIKYQGSKLNQTGFNQSLSFISLRGVFSLWFQNFTNGTYGERDLQGFFTPLNEWINIQLAFNQTTGFDLRVIDIYGRTRSQTRQALTLGPQNAIALFQIQSSNFRGYLKSVQVYQRSQTIPIQFQSNSSSPIIDDNLLIYFDFTLQNFVSNRYVSLARTSSNSQGQNLTFNGTLQFNEEIFPATVIFDDGLIVGGLNQTFSNYDGLSCIVPNKRWVSLIGENSSISSNFSTQMSLSEATVEFWFKRSQPQTSSQIQYLVQVQTQDKLNQPQNIIMEILQEANQSNLYCIIQKSNLTSTEQIPGTLNNSSLNQTYNLTLDQYNQSNYNQWQYVGCRFKSKFEIQGVQRSQNGIDLLKSMDISQEKAINFTSSRLSIIIGNNFSGQYGLQGATIVREFRFWNISRTLQQLRQFANTQINSYVDPGLLSYFRLGTGELQISNQKTLEQQEIKYSGLQLASDSSSALICPINSYQSSFSNCQRNPYLKSPMTIMSFYDPVNGTISWMLTPQYSDYYSPFTLSSDLEYNWQSNNLTSRNFLTQLSTRQKINETLAIPNSFINSTTVTIINSTDGSNRSTVVSNSTFNTAQFQFFSQTTNKAKSFIQTSVGQFRLNPCRLLVDYDQGTPNVSLISQDDIGIQDILFRFSPRVLSNCTLFQDERLLQTSSLEIYPSYLNISNSIITYDSSLSIYSLNFTKQEQLKLSFYQQVTFLITIYWANAVQNGQFEFLNILPETRLNMIYQVRFVKKIEPKLIMSTPYPQLDEDFWIDASQSSYSDSSQNLNEQVWLYQNISGIDYEWECPGLFQWACNRHQSLKGLQISSLEFNKSGGVMDQPYVFNLKLRSQMDIYDDNYFFNKSFTVTWVRYSIPSFYIGIFNRSKVFLLEDNTFEIVLNNYLNQTGLLSFTWSITPNLTNASFFMSFSSDSTRMTILKGGLIRNTSYTLSVLVQNIYRDTMSATEALTFYSGVGNLVQGDLQFEPQQGGYADMTVFQIGLINSPSDYSPVNFDLYGLQDAFAPPFLIKQNASSNVTLSTTLPLLSLLRVRVFDSIGNTFTITKNISVSVNQGSENVTVPMDNITTQMYTYFQQLEIDAETTFNLSLDLGNVINSQVLEAKYQTLYSVYLYAMNFQLDLDDNLYNKIILQKSMRILRLLTNSTAQLNNTLATMAHDAFAMLKLKQTNYLSLLQSSTSFGNDLLLTLSSLRFYTANMIDFLIEQQTKPRQLFSNSDSPQRDLQQSDRDLYLNEMYYQDFVDFAEDIEAERKLFISQYCQSAVRSSSRQIQLDSASYNFIFEVYNLEWTYSTDKNESISKFSSNVPGTRSFIVSDKSSNLTVNNTQILDQLQRLNAIQNNSNYICLVSSTIKSDALDGFYFQNQSYAFKNTQQVKKTEIIDSQGFYTLVDSVELRSENASQPLMSIEFSYNFTERHDQFNRNQTVCMSTPADRYDLIKKRSNWEDKDCKTVYIFSQNVIRCECISLGNRYYALIIDFSREITPDEEYSSSLRLKTSYYLIILLVFLILLLVALLPIASALDKKENRMIEQGGYKLDNFLLMKVAKRRYKPVSMIKYRSPSIKQYLTQITSNEGGKVRKLGCCSTLNLLCRQSHPLISIFSHHSATNSRLRRACPLIVQIDLVTLIALIFFEAMSNQGNLNESGQEETITKRDAMVAVYVGILCGLILFPIPSRVQNWFRSRFEVDVSPQALQKRFALEEQLEQRLDQVQNKQQEKIVIDLDEDNEQKRSEEKKSYVTAETNRDRHTRYEGGESESLGNSSDLQENGESEVDRVSEEAKARPWTKRERRRNQILMELELESEEEQESQIQRRGNNKWSEVITQNSSRANNYETSRKLMISDRKQDLRIKADKFGPPLELNDINLETRRVETEEKEEEDGPGQSQRNVTDAFQNQKSVRSRYQMQQQRGEQRMDTQKSESSKGAQKQITQDQGTLKRKKNQTSKIPEKKPDSRSNYDIYTQVKISDNHNSTLKCILIPFTIGFTLALVLALIILSLNMDPTYQFQIMIAVAVALILGWLILNPLRLMLVSCILEDWVKRQRISKKSKQELEECDSCLRFTLISKDEIEMMKDLLAVQEYVSTPKEDDSLVGSKAAFMQRSRRLQVSQRRLEEDKAMNKKQGKEIAYSMIMQNQERDSPKSVQSSKRKEPKGQHYKTYDNAQTPQRVTMQTSALQSTQSKNPQSIFSKTAFGPKTFSQGDRKPFANQPAQIKHNNFVATDRNSMEETKVSHQRGAQQLSQKPFSKHPLFQTHQEKSRTQGQRNFQKEDRFMKDVGDDSGSLESRMPVVEESNQQTQSFHDEEDKMMERDIEIGPTGVNRGAHTRVLTYSQEEDEVEDGLSESNHSNQSKKKSRNAEFEVSSESNSSIISKVPLDKRTRRVDSDTLQLQVNPSVVEKLKSNNHSVISFSRLSEIKESPDQRDSIKAKRGKDRSEVLLRYLQDQDLESGSAVSLSNSQRSSPSPVVYILPENRREPEEEDAIDQSRRRRELLLEVNRVSEVSGEKIFNDFEWEMESFRENSPDIIERQRRQDRLQQTNERQESFASDEQTPDSPGLSVVDSLQDDDEDQRIVYNPWQKQSIASQLSQMRHFPQVHNYELRQTHKIKPDSISHQNNGIQILSSGVLPDESVSRDGLSHQASFQRDAQNLQSSSSQQIVREVNGSQGANFENEQSIKESSDGGGSSSQSAVLYSAKDRAGSEQDSFERDQSVY